MTDRKVRFTVRTLGYWSYVFDHETGREASHGYDIRADAMLDASQRNRDLRIDRSGRGGAV